MSLKKYKCPKCKQYQVLSLFQRNKNGKNFKCHNCNKILTRKELGLKPIKKDNNISKDKDERIKALGRYLRSYEYQSMIRRKRMRGYSIIDKK